MPAPVPIKAQDLPGEQERRLEAALRLLPSHVVVLDANGAIAHTNRSREEFAEIGLGWLATAFGGANNLDPDARAAGGDPVTERCVDGIRSVILGRQPAFAMEYPRQSPTKRWFAMRVEGMSRPHGGAVVSHDDITERKNEQMFHAGQKRALELIAADALLPDVLTSILHLIELQSNGMLCSILLLDEDGLHVRHGAAPSLPAGYINAVNGAPIGPKAGSCGTAMYRGQQVIVTDILNDPLWEDYRSLAQTFQLGACWSTPIKSSNGKVLGSFAMYYHEPRSPNPEEMRLISVATHLAGIAIERRKTEETLRRSEEQYRRIVATAYEGVWVVDASSTLVFVNHRMAEMLGYSVDEMIGRSTRDFLEGESSEQADERAERRRAGIKEQFDFRFRRKDGSELWGIVSTTPVMDEDNRFSGALGMVTDITQRKRAEEELRRSNEQIRELAGRLITVQEEERRRIARELHDDIVQKVASLAINISMVKKRLPASADSVIPDVEALQQRVFGLAGDIRQLSHQLHPAALEHAGLIAALKSFATEFSQLEGIGVKLTVPESNDAIPPDIAICVYRVVQESLRNVAKHSGSKAAEVVLAIEGTDLYLAIKDQGKGFDVQHARGSGLGMLSVEERVRLCGGSIEIISELNRGTALTVRFPLE
jgi:PAS domain S-box-containing protein